MQMKTMNHLAQIARCSFFLLALAAVGCASETKPAATPSGGESCSTEECAKIPEPPISPMACGEGKSSEIGTACVRSAEGKCNKALTCGGKRPQ